MSLDEGSRAHQDRNNDTDVQSKGRGEGNPSLVLSGSNSYVTEGGTKKSLANDEVYSWEKKRRL